MGARPNCVHCYECQVCVTCEKFGPPRGASAPPKPVQPSPQPPPINEERIRQIVLEMLIELGLIPEAKKRAKITPTK